MDKKLTELIRSLPVSIHSFSRDVPYMTFGEYLDKEKSLSSSILESDSTTTIEESKTETKQ